MRIAALLLAFSLALIGWSSPTSDFKDRVKAAKSKAEFQQAIDSAPVELSADPGLHLQQLRSRTDWQEAQVQLESMLAAREIFSGVEPEPAATAKTDAKQILDKPIYADSGPAAERNWLSEAVSEIMRAIGDMFRPPRPKINAPNLGAAPTAAAMALKWVVIVVLLAALVGGAFFVISRVKLGRRNRLRRGGGLLDDDEPDRTADEWMARAEALANQGKHREAVRCLYLACLMRFDEHGVARFDRSETNWEHLRRIKSSAKRPVGFDFQAATLLFDNVWYGNRSKGSADYDSMKEMYTRLMTSFSSGRAA